MTPEVEAVFNYITEMPFIAVAVLIFLGYVLGSFTTLITGAIEELKYILREYRHKKRLDKSCKELVESFEEFINREDG